MPEGLDLTKYKLHNESLTYLNKRSGSELNVSDVLNNPNGIEESRRKAGEMSAKFAGEVEEFKGTVKEFKVPSVSVPAPDGIPIDVIKPTNCSSNPLIIVYFHGGGFVFGSRKICTPICKVLAKDTPCIVVNVEYRLAPEHKFPACFEDGKNVLRWVMMNKALLGGMNDSKVGIMGADAGGAIAATVCHEVKGIAFQVLIYPWLDLSNGVLCEEFASGPVLRREVMAWCADQLVNSPDEKANPRVSPIVRPSFTCLPPTLLLLAEFDALREQAYEYKRKVKEAGIDAESLMIKGSVHGFFDCVGHFKELGLKSRERLVTFLKKKGMISRPLTSDTKLLI